MTESGSKSTNFGLPNWRNENEYPDESAALELWRWQFIRRRDDYRKDWHNHKLETYNYFKRLHKNKKVLTPDHDEFMCRIPDSIEKYGLRRCPNPALDRPKRLQSPAPDKMDFFDGWLGNQHAHLDNKGRETTLPIPPFCTWVSFDITKPIKEQIDNAKSTLLDLQEEMTRRFGVEPESRRKRMDKWRNYLRALDAREDGQTLATIAREILAPNNLRVDEQTAYDVLNQAKALMHNFPR